jgi:DNA helicase-2/ATP-dependent DNA helicase PcrA
MPPREGYLDSTVTDDPVSRRFDVGQRVFHDKFGYGRVATVEGNKLDVVFETSGAKKVIDAFVRPA